MFARVGSTPDQTMPPVARSLDIGEEASERSCAQFVGTAALQELQQSAKQQEPRQPSAGSYDRNDSGLSPCSSTLDAPSSQQSPHASGRSRAKQQPIMPRPPSASASGQTTPRSHSGRYQQHVSGSPGQLQPPGSNYSGDASEPRGPAPGLWSPQNLVQAAMQDEYSMLMADTPLEKLRRKQEEVVKEDNKKPRDAWKLLKLHQDMLALSKVHAFLHRDDDHRPMLLPNAHFELAKRYAAVGCASQATEHCQRASEHLPSHSTHLKQVQALKANINILLAEGFITSNPPKPQAALQQLYEAAGTNNFEEGNVKLDIIVLASQALTQQADAKLHEAKGTRMARDKLSIQHDEYAIAMRKAEKGKRMLEMANLRDRLNQVVCEQQSEVGYEVQLLEEALKLLNDAQTMLMNVTVAEEKRLEEEYGRETARQDALIRRLQRQLCDMTEREAAIHELAGNLKQQKRALTEILSAHETYQCASDSMLARTLKHLGAAMARNGDYEDALMQYQALIQLQEKRFEHDYKKQQLALAECHKLCGNVFIARKEFGRAEEQFDLAYNKYVMEHGPHHPLVLDLEHRRRELASYSDPHLTEPTDIAQV